MQARTGSPPSIGTVIAGVLLLHVASCQTWRNQALPLQPQAVVDPTEATRLVLHDGRKVYLLRVRAVGDSIVGVQPVPATVARSARVSLPLTVLTQEHALPAGTELTHLTVFADSVVGTWHDSLLRQPRRASVPLLRRYAGLSATRRPMDLIHARVDGDSLTGFRVDSTQVDSTLVSVPLTAVARVQVAGGVHVPWPVVLLGVPAAVGLLYLGAILIACSGGACY